MAGMLGAKNGVNEEDDGEDDGEGPQLHGFHNPLFNSNEAAPKTPSLFPKGHEEGSQGSGLLSTLLMMRHGRKDGRKDGATVDITRRRTDEQVARLRKKDSCKQIERMGTVDVPACVVVKQEDASDAGEVLQHCAFRMETFRVHDQNSPDSISFRFVFNPGLPSQAVLDVTHVRRRVSGNGIDAAAGAGAGAGSGQGQSDALPGSSGGDGGRGEDGGEGDTAIPEKVSMTLGGMHVPHSVAGEPYSCQIRQVGTVAFNPRKQAKGHYLYILSQEQRTLFSSIN